MGEKEKVCNFVRSKETTKDYYFTNYIYHLINFKTYEKIFYDSVFFEFIVCHRC